ncbi:VWA domain-containing protein [Nocardia altamirensis]|uniref:VWA domain-containing protein n=1 Tax=Nocardia altamirensis TaxID=472158 RepID=UPI0008401DF4|nr:VWA domain-containing protein [Nocardia altamirensis]
MVSILAFAVGASACGREVPGTHTAGKCDAAVILLFDVSLSMQATDVAPTRLVVAQQASTVFATKLPPETLLGLVEFAGTGVTLVAPSTDRDAVKAALAKFELKERTATGEGIYKALDALSAAGPTPQPAQIVLLSDGKQTVPAGLDEPRGAYPAARDAKQQHIRISTIALGTKAGTIEVPGSPPSNGADPPPTGHRVPVPAEHDSLREIARLTDGTFHTATDLDELTKAFDLVTCRR